MTTTQPLSLFISSKMAELAEERQAVQRALNNYNMYGWLFEKDAGARPESIQQTYLEEVASCDIYLGLFWQGYGQYTIEEFEKARSLHKPCLVYEKQVAMEQRDPQLTTFLRSIQQVTDPRGVTVRRFQTARELAEQVSQDVLHLLITDFRKSRKQPPVWNIPYRRNPFFTGREDVLQQLHEYFTQAKTAALTQPPAITGLGGIGKTQVAVEYAYRYKDEYHDIFWVNATSRETLIEGFVTIARLLALSAKDEHDQTIIVAAVQQWLTKHSDWLLIMDNADDSRLATEFFPTGETGHILFTTREQAWGAVARNFTVEKMDETEGVLFLLRRANILTSPDAPLSEASSAQQTTAAAIVKAMDGLPLALDQAGAYIEETPSTLDAYLKAYQHRQTELLHERGKDQQYQHEAVATTWSLNFEQVEQLNPIAADLLRFLAFLAPDAIPEEMIVTGAGELGPQLQVLSTDETLLDQPMKVLSRFSLVQRDMDRHLLFIHRLVQAVLKANMTHETQRDTDKRFLFIHHLVQAVLRATDTRKIQRKWAERTVRAVNLAFPDVTDVELWPQCERVLPHALTCADLINDYTLKLPEAARLLNQTGYYLNDHAQYERAKPLYERALVIYEQVLGPNHPDTASSLNNLAALYKNQGDYEQAKPLYERALAIHEQALGPNHPDTASSLNHLALLYNNQGDY